MSAKNNKQETKNSGAGEGSTVFDVTKWPVLVIVGPTASGKTGLAINVALELARRDVCDCEIISADSRAIYKGMDIGTAKPTEEEMRGITHWGIDLVEPNDRFTVADFCEYAHFVVFGIDWPREKLRERIAERSNNFFAQPIEEETARMVEMYGWESQAMKSNIYPICWDMMQGKISLEEAKRLFEIDDWHLAKRQLTWFKRNENIIWTSLEGAQERIINFYLSK